MSLVSEGGWVDGLQCEHKCSPSLVKEKSECDLENVAIKGLGFAFSSPHPFSFAAFGLNSHIWVQKLKSLSPLWKGTGIHLSICLLLTYRAVQRQETLALLEAWEIIFH